MPTCLAVVYKTQASKRYVESLPLVLKDTSYFSQGERFTVQLPLDRTLVGDDRALETDDQTWH